MGVQGAAGRSTAAPVLLSRSARPVKAFRTVPASGWGQPPAFIFDGRVSQKNAGLPHLEPVRGGTGGAVKDVLRRHRTDASWAGELAALRQLVEVEERN